MILKDLNTRWAGRTCLSFEKLGSTNDHGMSLAKEQGVHGKLIVADTQTAGRGRRGRSWQSPAGTAVHMSLCLEPEFPAERAAGLTLVMALAVAEAVKKLYDTETFIKWPNDLVVNQKKVCGILTEMCIQKDHYAVVIGLGVNVNTKEFPDEIRETATSLLLETGRVVSRETLMAEILNYFERFYEQYIQTQDLSLLKERYEHFLINKGRNVRVLDPKGIYTGVAKGITSDGNLIIVCDDGCEKFVSSGEVSVRGLYGYV